MKPGSQRQLQRRPCPHCGKPFAYLGTHVDKCIKNPTVWAATLAGLDNGEGYIRRTTDYRGNARGGMGYKELRLLFGPWHKVAEAFGLRMYGNYSPRGGIAGYTVQSALDRRLVAIGAEMDAEMAEYRKYTHPAYRG